ncbi:hypothetical protein V9K67_19900 [Paraflavisolibacter sp. H34]|uniref:hypothetical protein n=1 Tax=Huijunlia imazamoxiresistens TaxID=3127457 RepID=UPI003015EF08
MKRAAAFLTVFLALAAVSCKNKKAKEKETSFFPALSFIRSQVAHVDTSLYTIMKIVRTDSLADTSYLKREEFRQAAQDFLSLPDISSGQLKEEYEETQFFDADLNQAVLNYMPKADDGAIRRQEVMIQPNPGADKVSAIFVDLVKTDGDSTLKKVLYWQVDKRFRVSTTVEKPDFHGPTQTLEVIWNDFPSAK